MLSFVVALGEIYKNTTKGLLGTWNDDPNDDFTLPDGTVLSSSSSSREIHFGFGVTCEFMSSFIDFFLLFFKGTLSHQNNHFLLYFHVIAPNATKHIT